MQKYSWDGRTLKQQVQIGLLDPKGLPVAEIESAQQVLDPTIPANSLIRQG